MSVMAKKKTKSVKEPKTNGQANSTKKQPQPKAKKEGTSLASIIDPVVLAIGQYAQENLGLSEKAIHDNFTEQLSRALDGNATWNLEEAGDAAQAYLMSAAE